MLLRPLLQFKRVSFGGVLLAFSLFALMLGPVWVFGGAKNIYVDKDNKGSEDGSKDHPYRSIDKALKKAKKGGNVFVAKGRYKTNITIPKNVRLIGGKSTGDVVIEGDDNDPTVTMQDDTEIKKITIKGGRHGIRVEEAAEAKIIEVVIKDSQRDGIHIDRGTLLKKDEVYIEKTEIKDNQKAGIFSERRHLIVIDTEIVRNQGDGVDVKAGVKTWFKDVRIHDNRGSGMKTVLDASRIAGRDVSIRRNAREGIEVNAYGQAGSVNLREATLIDNGRYGVASIVRAPGAEKTLLSLVLTESRMEGNRFGSLSQPLWVQ